jgi:hypothetical protein
MARFGGKRKKEVIFDGFMVVVMSVVHKEKDER